MHRSIRLAAAGLFVIAGCAKASSTSPAATTAAPATTAPAGAVGATPGGITVAFSHMPSGTATLTWDPSTKAITASLDMFGFTPGSSHAIHIHTGSCLNQHNPPIIPFPDVTADASGVIKATTTSNPVAAGIPTGAYLNLHLAPGSQLGSPTDLSFTPIACADIPAGTAAAGPVTLTMSAPPQPGQAPAGSATLTYDAMAHTLAATLTVTGLAPNSMHAVHIHTGSCRAQGPVAYPLPDLSADASGKATVTTTVPSVTAAPPATGWYVNVHLGPMSGILADGKPTLSFQPILCGDVHGG